MEDQNIYFTSYITLADTTNLTQPIEDGSDGCDYWGYRKVVVENQVWVGSNGVDKIEWTDRWEYHWPYFGPKSSIAKM